MITFNAYIHLRYVLLLNVIAELVPADLVRGRSNDPLRNASWWTPDQHSAVMVISAGAVLGAVLFGLAVRLRIVRVWTSACLGGFIGAFPGLFYLLATPSVDAPSVPALSMIVEGACWGGLLGLVTRAVLRKQGALPAPN